MSKLKTFLSSVLSRPSGQDTVVQQSDDDFLTMMGLNAPADSKNQTPTDKVLWDKDVTFFLPLQTSTLKIGQELFDQQISHLGSALIVDDYNANVIVDTCQLNAKSKLKFPQGALLSGSYVMHVVARHVGSANVEFDDCDIYFKTKKDAMDFVVNNGINIPISDQPVCAYGYHEGQKFNLIFGVEYNSPEHLISRFDIRACSMAIDPNTNTLYVVRGSIEDTMRKQLVFNPVPRGCSMRRYAKYIKKGFHADSHQNLFFVELLKTDIYKPELELLTKEY